MDFSSLNISGEEVGCPALDLTVTNQDGSQIEAAVFIYDAVS